MKSLATVILAAGKGTRMKSALPKVLHPLCGQPLIRYPVRLARQLGSRSTVLVVGHGAEAVEAALAADGVRPRRNIFRSFDRSPGLSLQSGLIPAQWYRV